jgi:pimeloyl-ACP methyl ester carboxylesterase
LLQRKTLINTRSHIMKVPKFTRMARLGRGAVAAAAATTALAATAAWIARKAHRAEHDNPPLGTLITVDGVRLHYIEKGSGIPLVLLHGNVVRLQDFLSSGLFDRLSEHYRVIAFDRPGFGYSERPRDRLWTAQAQAELLQKALWEIRVEQPIVLGHSWGTLVALELALCKSLAVRRLVLVSGYYYPTLRLDVPIAAAPAVPVIGDVMRYTVSAVSARLLLNRTVKAMFSPQRVPPHFLPGLVREMMLRPAQLRANSEDAAFMVPAAAALAKRYKELTMPVVILAGAADKVVEPDRHACQLSRELSNSELRILPGLGHMIHYFAVDEIVSAVAPHTGMSPRASPQAAVPG